MLLYINQKLPFHKSLFSHITDTWCVAYFCAPFKVVN